ncbi:MAG: hypothetical protein M3Y17_12015 [Actinomycetota bacterium]|nr:hypothetical protein [Actinomycetota bacterium]
MRRTRGNAFGTGAPVILSCSLGTTPLMLLSLLAWFVRGGFRARLYLRLVGHAPPPGPMT